MRQKLFIFAGIFLLLFVMIGLNALSYTQKEKPIDNEYSPNRSSFNSGATGTMAFYDLLSETGREVMRWQEPPEALLANKNAPRTFVVIGPLRREFNENEVANLLKWVSAGGKLVIIDREPPPELTKTTADWNISLSVNFSVDSSEIDPNDQNQITGQTKAVKPVQPTIYTQNVNAVQPSIFAGDIRFEALTEDEKENRRHKIYGIGAGRTDQPPQLAVPENSPPPKLSPTPLEENYFQPSRTPAPAPKYQKPPTKFEEKLKTEKTVQGQVLTTASTESYPPAFTAPVVHLGTSQKNLLVDAPYEAGEIVFLSDPFIVSNSGLNLVDNARLGINIVASREGAIAFDEYHHGFGSNKNRFLEYFAGTPVVAIFLQLALLLGLLFYSQSRRFARPVSDPEPSRLSKLEYVSAMAQLQQRTRAFDLAIENIYTDFRRRTAKFVGVDNYTTPRVELARLISERIKTDRDELEELMRKCEDIMHGEPTGKKEVVAISSRLREIEEKLGMRRGAKHVK